MEGEDTRQKLRQLILDGLFTTEADAARQLGVSRSRVSYILHHELTRSARTKELVL